MPKYVRRQFLINHRFQLKFAFLITLAMFVFTMAFPFFIMTLFDLLENPQVVLQKNQLAQTKEKFVIFTVVIESLFVLITFVLALFHSHKIAGPLYKLQMSMRKLQQGAIMQPIFFRKKDNFPELADEFNALSEALQSRRKKDLEGVFAAIGKLEKLKSELSEEQQQNLENIIQSLQGVSQSSKQEADSTEENES